MKKYLVYICIVMLFILSACSCSGSKQVSKYESDTTWETYLEMFYTDINTENLKYVAVDLRTKEAYETEHIRQFQNYDLSKGSIDELLNWLKSNYSKNHKVYIYIDEVDTTIFDSFTDYYENVHLYIGNYDSMKKIGEELFTFDSGPYDCGC